MKKWLFIIFTFAFLLRLVGLSHYPSGFTPDEASFGYDAYSILKTGKDQWGNFLPLTLKSFGDSKLPLYTYLDIPFVLVFGLNEFSTRLPNALVGSIAVVVVYFLVKYLFKNEKTAVLASGLLAFSPWHISMSRGAFEANLTTLFIPLGIYLFYKGIKENKYLLFSSIIFGLNLFSYHSARLITPLIVGFLIIINWKEVFSSKNKLVAGGVFTIFCLMAAYTMLVGGTSRVSTVGILSTSDGNGVIAENRYDAILAGMDMRLAAFFGNKFLYVWDVFSRNYVSYLSPQFLFTEGPREGTYGMVPGMSLMYIFEIAFLVGFLLLLGLTKNDKNLWLLVFWILISVIPASLAKGPGHAANRATIMMPAIQIASALGGVFLYEKIKPRYKYLVHAFLLVLFALSFIFSIEKYLVSQPMREAKSMIYGAEEVSAFISNQKDSYDSIYITKKLSEPHIYFAFYEKMDPRLVQDTSKKWNFEEQGFAWVDQMGEYQLDKYTFRSIDWKNQITVPGNYLFIGVRDDFPEDIQPLKIIKYPNGQDAYLIVESPQK